MKFMLIIVNYILSFEIDFEFNGKYFIAHKNIHIKMEIPPMNTSHSWMLGK
mgnify:CR=1 FL=1